VGCQTRGPGRDLGRHPTTALFFRHGPRSRISALVSLLVSAALAAFGKFAGGFLPLPDAALDAINFVVSLAGIAVLFALIFRYVPATRVAWKTVWIGAVATALLFTIGKFLIGLYLGKSAVGSPYGAAGSIIVIIVWVYYSAMIFLFGAEFTNVLDSGSGSPPNKAKPV
jgi:membrane protein